MKARYFIIVMYDIKETKVRTMFSRILEYYGLQRAQYSVFMGELDVSGFRELKGKIWALNLEQGDKIRIVDVCATCRKKMVVIGDDVPEKKQHMILG